MEEISKHNRPILTLNSATKRNQKRTKSKNTDDSASEIAYNGDSELDSANSTSASVADHQRRQEDGKTTAIFE